MDYRYAEAIIRELENINKNLEILNKKEFIINHSNYTSSIQKFDPINNPNPKITYGDINTNGPTWIDQALNNFNNSVE
jgi:hypothetical protein